MSRISEVSFCNLPFAVVLALSLLVFGSISFFLVPIDLVPGVKGSAATVLTVYPGASPEDVEIDVTDKIEKRISELDCIAGYSSTSREGASLVRVEFKPGKDVGHCVGELRDTVGVAMSELPEYAEAPVVSRLSTADMPLLVVSLSSTRSESEMYDYARLYVEKLRSLPGVGRVETYGARERKIRVEIDPDKLSQYGLTLTEFIERLSSDGEDLPGGHLDLGNSRFELRTAGRFTSLDDVRDTVIALRGGEPVHLGVVAQVSDGFADRETYGRTNGTPSVNICVYKQDGANTIRTSAAVRDALEAAKNELPEDVHVSVRSDQAETAKARIDAITFSGMIGAVLALFVLTMLVGFRLSILQSAAKRYAGTLNFLLRKPVVFPAFAAALLLICLTVALWGGRNLGLCPGTASRQFTLKVSAPPGSSLDATSRILRQAESRLEEIKKSLLYTTVAVGGGSESGFGYSLAQGGAETGWIRGEFKTKSKRGIASLTAKALQLMKDIPDARIELLTASPGSHEDSTVVVRVLGDDYDAIMTLATEIESRLGIVDGLTDVSDNLDDKSPQVVVKVDRNKAAAAGVSPASAGTAVRLAYTGIKAGEYFDDARNENVDVLVTFPDDAKQTPSQLARISLLGDSGDPVPMNQIAAVDFSSGKSVIDRDNGKRCAVIRANVRGMSASEAYALARKALSDISPVRGLSVEYACETGELRGGFKGLGVAIVAALLVVYALLVLGFRSYVRPLVVFFSVLLSTAGAFLGLLVSNSPAGSIVAVAGFAAVAAVVANQAVALIYAADRLREKGVRKALALRQACRDRMRPVFLTSVFVIAGFLPLALGLGDGWQTTASAVWTPLGWAIVFGLAVSAFLVLLVTPSMYMIFTWLEEEFFPSVFRGTRRR